MEPHAPDMTIAEVRNAKRTMMAGEPRTGNIGQKMVLKGWVHRRRDLGGIIFIDLRDRTGLLQLRINPEIIAADRYQAAHQLRSEYCVSVYGEIRERPEGTENPKLATGDIELVVLEFDVLAPSKPLPFQVDEYDHTSEEIRLRYRFLDLRREEMQRNLVLRHKAYQATRRWLCDHGFLEFETPILTKATPEGARDFLVPSRLDPGTFYALPQSPQLFKQLLMMSGFDKYFQIAKCFRDEDLRANRQPEFTQIDVEMSFVDEDDVMTAMEQLTAAIVQETVGHEIPLPLPRIPYDEAMLRFGSDKPDLRFGMEIHDVSAAISRGCNFQVFNNMIKKGGAVRGVCLEGKADELSNTDLRPDSKFSKAISRECDVRAYAWFKVNADGALESSIAKFFEQDALDAIKAEFGAKPGDVIFFVAHESPAKAAELTGRLRLFLARRFDMIPAGRFACAWIVDFPAFEYDPEEKRYFACHHPFTSPREEDIDKMGTEKMGEVRARAYDMTMNGEELCGGSIRINRMDVQQEVFQALGIGEEEAQEKFGFLLEALQYGAPPHGGVAFGFDRLIMLLANEDSIRAVIPFPKTQTGSDPLTGAPTPVPAALLQELDLRSTFVPKKDGQQPQG